MARKTDPRRTRAAQSKTAWLRGFCNSLRIARLCDNAACRAARACRGGDPRRCWSQNGRRLPDEVQLWALCLCDARAQDMTCDEAMAALHATPMGAAFAAWVMDDGDDAARPAPQARS